MFSPRLKKSLFSFNKKGFGIVEALVGITIAAFLLVAFTSLIWQTMKVDRANTKDIKATAYLQELIEVAKDLKQTPSGWQTIINTSCNDSSPCYPAASGSDWILISSPIKQTLENNAYTRWLTIENVSRDPSNNEILDPYDPANDDPDTKKVFAKIQWNNGFQNKERFLETYVYNYNP